MRGNDQVIAQLNEALREELTAINQYFLHAEMCHNWGYHRLGDYISKQSIDEMKHAEKLIERLLFLDATPKMDYMELNVGQNVKRAARGGPQARGERGRDVQQGDPGVARAGDDHRASCFRCCSRTKSSTSTGSKLRCTRSRRSGTSGTCRTRPKAPRIALARSECRQVDGRPWSPRTPNSRFPTPNSRTGSCFKGKDSELEVGVGSLRLVYLLLASTVISTDPRMAFEIGQPFPPPVAIS